MQKNKLEAIGCLIGGLSSAFDSFARVLALIDYFIQHLFVIVAEPFYGI
jgi:hypothetical protein